MKLTTYCRHVIEHPEMAPYYVRLAVDRFKKDLEESLNNPQSKYYFDPTEVDKFEAFAECITMKDGENEGKPFKIEPWESFIVGNLFGWKKRVDNRYRFNNAYIAVPRKNGKTALVSLITLYMMMAQDRFSFSGLCVASTERQARKLFKDIKELIKYDPALKSLFKLKLDEIQFALTNAVFEVFASSAPSLDGRNDDFSVIDEAHALTDSALYDVLQSGLAGKPNKLLLLITTAGFSFNGFCFTHEQYCKKVLRGEEDNERLFAVIYQPDEGDDLSSPAVWRKVNPNYGVSIMPDDFYSQYQEGKSSPTKWNNFKVKQLNFWTKSENTWLKRDEVLKHMVEFDEEELRGERCYLSMDLSQDNDLSTYCLTFPMMNGKYRQIFRTWIPLNKLEEKTRYENSNYPGWLELGIVKGCAGDVIDYEDIFCSILMDAKKFAIQEISFDSLYAQELANKVHEALPKIPLIPIKQTKVTFTPIVMTYENQLFHDLIEIEKNELVLWNFTNAILSTNTDFRKPEKRHNEEKIDLLIVSLVSFFRASICENSGEYTKPKLDFANFGFFA